MKIKAQVFRFGIRNRNGRTYTYEGTRAPVTEEICVYPEALVEHGIDSVIGTARLTKTEEGVWATIQLFGSLIPFENLDAYAFVSAGHGAITDGVVNDFEITKLCLITREESGWYGLVTPPVLIPDEEMVLSPDVQPGEEE